MSETPQKQQDQKPAEQLFQELLDANNLTIGFQLVSFAQDNGTMSLKPILNVSYKN